jgi:hypothetical protein
LIHNITDIKDGNFKPDSFSLSHNINFDLNNLADFKQGIHEIVMLTVRATGMKFVSIADNNNFICREWTIVKDYHIDGMSLVKSVNNSRFKKCWSFNNSIYKTYTEYG